MSTPAPHAMRLVDWLALEAKAFGDEPKPISERSIAWHKGQLLEALCDGKRVSYSALKDYPGWNWVKAWCEAQR